MNEKDEAFRAQVLGGSLWKVLIKVCLPLALYSWISQLFSVLDTLMASGISSEAVSTVVYMVQLQHIVLAVGGGLSVGGGIMIAHAYGRGDGKRIKSINSTVILLCAVLSLLIILVLPFTPTLLRLMGTPEVFVNTGSGYFAITLIGICVQFFNTVYIANERCRGRSRKILVLNLVTVAVKLGITAIAVYIIQGDILSIAFASLVSYLVIFSFALASFIKKDDEFAFSIHCVRLRGLVGELLKLSLPSMVEKIAFAGGKAMVNNMAAGYGTEAVGAAGVSNNMSGLLTGIQSGMEDGGATLTGQLHGSGDTKRTVAFYRRLQLSVIVVGVVGAVLMRILTDPIARLFSLSRGGYDAAFHQMICDIFHYELMGCIMLSFAYSGIAFLLGLGKTKLTLVINVARIFIFRLPVIWYLSNYTSLGYEAVGWTMAISNTSVGMMAIIVCEVVIWKLRKKPLTA